MPINNTRISMKYKFYVHEPCAAQGKWLEAKSTQVDKDGLLIGHCANGGSNLYICTECRVVTTFVRMMSGFSLHCTPQIVHHRQGKGAGILRGWLVGGCSG